MRAPRKESQRAGTQEISQRQNRESCYRGLRINVRLSFHVQVLYRVFFLFTENIPKSIHKNKCLIMIVLINYFDENEKVSHRASPISMLSLKESSRFSGEPTATAVIVLPSHRTSAPSIPEHSEAKKEYGAPS